MSSIFRQASFEISVASARQLPADEGYEVAFAGRSNAGKSSAINALTGNARLARTSKTPGRTQQLNFFRLDPLRAIVDLPGYGFAKVPERVRQQWYSLIDGYLENRQALRGLVLIMDCRHPFGRFDDQILGWATVARLPVHILLSKADKLGRNQQANTLRTVRKQLTGMELDGSVQLFSATRKMGIDELSAKLADWMELGPSDPAS
ncbi:MAG TPA: YihA family ribosome biogenesis GTP-binding protein [Gammaproteobacteria bacterium]|nr:YihA family ribosome biogenesis GTP-binding protein [Gammaproteobacteria bacterium]